MLSPLSATLPCVPEHADAVDRTCSSPCGAYAFLPRWQTVEVAEVQASCKAPRIPLCRDSMLLACWQWGEVFCIRCCLGLQTCQLLHPAVAAPPVIVCKLSETFRYCNVTIHLGSGSFLESSSGVIGVPGLCMADPHVHDRGEDPVPDHAEEA